jgi:uncharacterized membrane protein
LDYLTLKWLHILSSTVLFGAGVGSAFHLFAATLRADVGGIAGATRNVVTADWLLTAPAAVLQPVSGIGLVHMMGLPLSTPWVAASFMLYAVAIACWLPVLWIQLRMRAVAVQAAAAGTAMPARYAALFRWWVALGVLAFAAFLAIFWLMVFKRVPGP